MQIYRPTKLAIELEKELISIDILHESYSCTIETPYLTAKERTELRKRGFEIIHEESDIYTLKKNHG